MLTTKLALNVNGQECELRADVRSTLLDVLRETLALTGRMPLCGVSQHRSGGQERSQTHGTDDDRNTPGFMRAGGISVHVRARVQEVEAIVVPEEDARVNSLGVKGIGEHANTGTDAAIANAVYHATGRRIRRLPIRIEDLL